MTLPEIDKRNAAAVLGCINVFLKNTLQGKGKNNPEVDDLATRTKQRCIECT